VVLRMAERPMAREPCGASIAASIEGKFSSP
jgi:hypothetical protein